MFRFFSLFAIAFITLSVIGCDGSKMSQDILSEISDDTDTQTQIAVCNVGDILMTGESCSDPKSDAIFTVLENGNSSYTSPSGILFEATDILDTEGASLNDVLYSFRASKLDSGGWQILSDRKQLNWPLILSAIGDSVINETLIPVNDMSEWINNSPAPGIWEKSIEDKLSDFSFPKGDDSHLKRYVGWMYVSNWETDSELGPSYPHWFYSHADSTMIWDISKYDVIRFEGSYLLPAYQARDTDEDDGNVEITWYADDSVVYSSGKNSWENIKDTTTSDLPGFYKWIIEMNFDIPQGTDQLKLHVSNSDDGVEYDHFVILNPKLYTTQPNNTN